MNTAFAIKNPTAFLARGIEDLEIREKNSSSFVVKVSLSGTARLISVTVFPIFLSLELVFKHIPKLLLSIPICKANKKEATEQFNKNAETVSKFALAILFSPLGIRSASGIAGFFLETPNPNAQIRPFGVEMQYGRKTQEIHYPTDIADIQTLVKKANQKNKPISVIGAGMSQGPQTVPTEDRHLVINTKKLNAITFEGNCVKVQAGATWEQIQIEANKRGKSVIVKQASDVFSIGGSIGINCHGWAHEYGTIASTVESLEIINAKGELQTLTPKDELFGCMFGTLGYFGVIVSATLKLEDNEFLIEKTKEVSHEGFINSYKEKIKGNDIPLFGGRLVLDNTEGNPLRSIFMVSYEREKAATGSKTPLVDSSFKAEPTYGTRTERIALQILSHLSYFSTRRLISKFWSHEKQMMCSSRKITRNEALHPPIKAFMMLNHSNLHAEWLQEYFITEQNLPNFLKYLGTTLKSNDVRLINATIRPTPKDTVSILPYAEQDRYAVVICFRQLKTDKEIAHTKKWIENVNQYLINQGDVYYQAYMPYATQEQFETCYGKTRVAKMRALKIKYDPENRFSNGHTVKYFDLPKQETL